MNNLFIIYETYTNGYRTDILDIISLLAILCAILHVHKYGYKIKKELCESEQWKYLNSKSALALYEFEMKSLHSVRFLDCFLSHMRDFL